MGGSGSWPLSLSATGAHAYRADAGLAEVANPVSLAQSATGGIVQTPVFDAVTFRLMVRRSDLNRA